MNEHYLNSHRAEAIASLFGSLPPRATISASGFGTAAWLRLGPRPAANPASPSFPSGLLAADSSTRIRTLGHLRLHLRRIELTRVTVPGNSADHRCLVLYPGYATCNADGNYARTAGRYDDRRACRPPPPSHRASALPDAWCHRARPPKPPGRAFDGTTGDLYSGRRTAPAALRRRPPIGRLP